jgi:hypothetical protein
LDRGTHAVLLGEWAFQCAELLAKIQTPLWFCGFCG